MEWEDKVEMIGLYNQEDHKFYDYVLSKISDFDIQAWDMLANCINPLKIDKEFVGKVKPFYQKLDTSKLGFRSAIRLEMAFGESEE